MRRRRICNRAKIGEAQSGFSVLETAIVVSIMLICMAIALPNFMTFMRRYKLHNDARALAGEYGMARMLASSTMKRALVTCNEATKICQIELMGITDSGYTTVNASQVSLSNVDSFGPPGTVGAGSSVNTGSQITTGAIQCDNVVFNTRGIPIYDSTTGAFTAACIPSGKSSGAWILDYVNYVKNAKGESVAVVIDPSGKLNLYEWNVSTSTWSFVTN